MVSTDHSENNVILARYLSSDYLKWWELAGAVLFSGLAQLVCNQFDVVVLLVIVTLICGNTVVHRWINQRAITTVHAVQFLRWGLVMNAGRVMLLSVMLLIIITLDRARVTTYLVTLLTAYLWMAGMQFMHWRQQAMETNTSP